MEYIPETLDPLNFDNKKAVSLATQILSALAHIHASDITHGDVKPNNILIQQDCYFIAKLADFGTARPQLLEGTDIVVGTPLYWAPEILEPSATVTSKADIFAFGLVLLQ